MAAVILGITICADNHERGFREALALEPSLAATRPIGCECVFGDDAFKGSLSTRLEQCVTVAIKLITELNAVVGIVAD